MERDVGIVGYLTSTPGLGGTIKSAPEDFVVEEISSPPAVSPEGRYAIAQVRVRNWETNRLVRAMARALHISRKRIGYAGTKDKHAVTTRLFSFEGVLPEAVRGLQLKDVDILDAFRSDRPLELGDLAGNRFRIVVRDLPVEPEIAAKTVEETARALRIAGGFPSFFGIQRFGSVRPITHVVGRHLVRGEFREAVEAYVANPLEGEDPESYEVRSALRDTGDIQTALRSYPKSYGFEKAILNQLAVEPTDYVGALRSLPFNLLMMFVHGYQSFLFNRILSERMRRRIPIHEPVAGDLVLPADASGLPDRSRTIDVTCDNLERAAKRCREGKAWVSAILFGSEPEFAGGEPGQIEKTIVASEGLRPEDFIIPEIPRISSKGTRREILAPFRGLDVQVGEAAFSLSFELTRGSYATCLVREFTKSE
ncbi:MAG: tRNA pseudouridine(13) synthase TruD [Methanobacteriota archaeon]|nr:MAG: tRNA pseudouridine(13) synthase TruD [Euryarchaeota archaeon]